MTDKMTDEKERPGTQISGWEGERDVSTQQGDLTGATDQGGSGQTSEPRMTRSTGGTRAPGQDPNDVPQER